MFSNELLKDKKILITGGGTGIGKAMAERFLELGAHIVICGRRKNVVDETVLLFNEKHPNCAKSFVCDVRNAADVEKMIEAIWAEGALDALVNNAAGNFLARTETLSHRAVDAVLNTVLHGTAYATLACGRRWLSEGRHGDILNIVTTYAESGSAYVVPSAMGKAGVLALTRSLAVEWGNRGIRVNALAPGMFPTEGAMERLMPNGVIASEFLARNPMGRVGAMIELSNTAAFLLSDLAPFINGECIAIDGGECIAGAGQFTMMRKLSEEDWKNMHRPS